MKKSNHSEILIFVIIIFLAFSLETCSNSSREDEIQSKIQSLGGETVIIDKKLTSIGSPFYFNDKYDDIYKITYKVNGETKEGWVRFRTFSTDWKLD